MRIRHAGFTLIEMMVVVAVVAILATIAAPGMTNIMAAAQVNAAQENLMQMLRKARSLSLGRGTAATMAISAANRQAVLSLMDGSAVNGTNTTETLNFPNVQATNATYRFNPGGTAQQTVGAGPIVLTSAVSSSATPARTITVSAAGQVTVY